MASLNSIITRPSTQDSPRLIFLTLIFLTKLRLYPHRLPTSCLFCPATCLPLFSLYYYPSKFPQLAQIVCAFAKVLFPFNLLNSFNPFNFGCGPAALCFLLLNPCRSL